MDPREFVSYVYMRFSQIINKLENLENTLSDQDCSNKILRSMWKEWQSKMIAIKESKDVKTLDISTIFGKLNEHEHELKRLEASEINVKKEGKD